MRERRVALSLNQEELAETLGFSDQGRSVRAWEHGKRNGRQFSPSGPALAALGMLEAIKRAHDDLASGRPERALETLTHALPAGLRK